MARTSPGTKNVVHSTPRSTSVRTPTQVLSHFPFDVSRSSVTIIGSETMTERVEGRVTCPASRSFPQPVNLFFTLKHGRDNYGGVMRRRGNKLVRWRRRDMPYAAQHLKRHLWDLLLYFHGLASSLLTSLVSFVSTAAGRPSIPFRTY